jgi:4-diphosphocytidyl-2-C-methyl-D-erythritol kinase
LAELIVTAPAKLNLVLRVGPRAQDGYHPVRSLMVALSAPTDEVRVSIASERRVECAVASGAENLAWAALDSLEEHVGRRLPVSVAITKTIPAQAGLGGGSSDAAAVLRAANALHECHLDESALERVAVTVGSDVPFFIRGGVQWAEGRGERLRAARAPEHLHLVIVDSGLALPTGAVYEAFDRSPSPALPGTDDPTPVNDLWQAALALKPALCRVVRDLRSAGAHRALLCGSGGAVAGLFSTLEGAESTATRLSATYRCWVAQPDTR